MKTYPVDARCCLDKRDNINLMLFEFNLEFPDMATFGFEIPEFNKTILKPIDDHLEFYPQVTIDNGLMKLHWEDTDSFYLKGEYEDTDEGTDREVFKISPDFYDYSDTKLGYKFIAYLCEKFKGTMIGVHIENRLTPIKIVDGYRYPVTLAMISDEDNE